MALRAKCRRLPARRWCSPSFRRRPCRSSDRLPVDVQASDLCGRFSGRIVRGVNTRVATPAWMVERLARCGQRSVSPLVDISNYVMFELGRPSHIFDLDKIHGGLQVRWGKPGEQLKLLNGNTVTVDEQVGVIADAQAVESLAGIMGGDATAVSDDTANIFIEAAFWWPKAIAGRSRRFNFSTDAGHRFERGVDPSTTVEHVERITQLVLDICGGQAGPLDDQTLALPEGKPVTLRVARAAKVIGMPLTQAQCAGALRRLGLEVSEGEGTVTVAPPAFRFDLQIEEDLIEEVARMIGYEQLPSTPPLAPITAKIRTESRRAPFAVRRQLAQLGYQETINFSFVEARWEHELAGNADPVKLLNPIASQMSVMRSSLLGSLIAALKFNLDRKAERVRLFEVGRVFFKDASVKDSDTTVAGFHQPMRVAGLAYGPADALQWGAERPPGGFLRRQGRCAGFAGAAAGPNSVPGEHPAMHPGRYALRVWLDGQTSASAMWANCTPAGAKATSWPRRRCCLSWRSMPCWRRDVPAFQSVEPASAGGARSGHCGQGVGDPRRRDGRGACARQPPGCAMPCCSTFTGPRSGRWTGSGALAPDEKSLAVRLVLSRDDATLTDEQIDAAVKRCADSDWSSRLAARLRG